VITYSIKVIEHLTSRLSRNLGQELTHVKALERKLYLASEFARLLVALVTEPHEVEDQTVRQLEQVDLLYCRDVVLALAAEPLVAAREHFLLLEGIKTIVDGRCGALPLALFVRTVKVNLLEERLFERLQVCSWLRSPYNGKFKLPRRLHLFQQLIYGCIYARNLIKHAVGIWVALSTEFTWLSRIRHIISHLNFVKVIALVVLARLRVDEAEIVLLQELFPATHLFA